MISENCVINHIKEEQDIERLRNIAIAWYESSMLIHKNEIYYNSICESIGKLIGKEAYTADDGVVHDSVFCCKIPDLVKALIEERDAYKNIAIKAFQSGKLYSEVLTKFANCIRKFEGEK